ncbi:MAG: archaellin/type IV pilin N-terminal domain-containing protein [Candidatus Nanoarchaeia archaeon]
MQLKRKKAIMGIGTLIIFIATILVAAVAAGVLISTSGVLQQRALMTGEEARQKITDSIEATSIVAYGDRDEETLNNFEVITRLDAGSDPLQMKGFGISFIGPRQYANARLAHPSLNDPAEDPDGFLENITAEELTTEEIDIRDLTGDDLGEKLSIDDRGENNDDALLFNLSDHDADYALVELNVDLSAGERRLRIKDEPIIGQDDNYYGFININANVTGEGNINLEGENYAKLSWYYLHECDFDVIRPEESFCYKVMHGEDRTILGKGETFMIKYKLSDNNALRISEYFEFIFQTERGRERRYQGRTPDVITTPRVPLWPGG